jgi:hypothetical protein
MKEGKGNSLSYVDLEFPPPIHPHLVFDVLINPAIDLPELERRRTEIAHDHLSERGRKREVETGAGGGSDKVVLDRSKARLKINRGRSELITQRDEMRKERGGRREARGIRERTLLGEEDHSVHPSDPGGAVSF